MPIKIQPVTSLNLIQVKKNFERIAREGMSLQKPDADNLYRATAPTAADLGEGQFVFQSSDGSSFRLYTKINGVVRYATLSA